MISHRDRTSCTDPVKNICSYGRAHPDLCYIRGDRFWSPLFLYKGLTNAINK